MRRKRYVVVNQKRWERFNIILWTSVFVLILALVEHFLGPCYR